MSRKKRLLALIEAALAALSLGLAACGDDDSSNDTTTEAAPAATTAPATTAPATPTAPATTAAAPAAAPIAVEADPTGQLAFVQKTLSAPAGEATFTFTNPAPVDHDFAIEQGGTELGATPGSAAERPRISP